MIRFVLACLLIGCNAADDDDDESSGDLPADPDAAEYVQTHNDIRAGVGVGPLSWDDEVALSALGWAEDLAADNCAFEHESQQTYGENLWWSSYEPQPAEVVNAWASEVAYYDYDSNTCDAGQMCGHYTQVVWADTEVVGCGATTCSDGSIIVNCRYDPPGNWVGERPY